MSLSIMVIQLMPAFPGEVQRCSRETMLSVFLLNKGNTSDLSPSGPLWKSDSRTSAMRFGRLSQIIYVYIYIFIFIYRA